MRTEIGPYRVSETIVAYDRTVMMLSAGAGACTNGDIVAYWNRFPDAIMGNEVYFIRSSDNGRTWEMTGEPISSIREEGSVHAATGMYVHGDGAVLLPISDYWSGRLNEQEHRRYMKGRHRPNSLHVLISNDHAHHWQERIDVETPDFRWVYPYGRMFEGVGGGLCMLFEASSKCCLDEDWKSVGSECGFVVSRDMGRTWGEYHCMVPAPNPENCCETTVARCPDGSLLAMHRNRGPEWLQSRSVDDGETWSQIAPSGLHGECGCLFADKDGRLIAAYRSHRKSFPDAPIGLIVVYSEDSGKTWTPEVVLPDPKGREHESFGETGMPDIVQLASGELAIVYYSFDPDLPFRHPKNEKEWDGLLHCFKRYIAVAILDT